jgi:hypothetical protein
LKRSWIFTVLLIVGAGLYGVWSAKYGPRYVFDFDALDAADQRVLQQNIRDQACSNPEVLRTIKENGFSYEYHYTNKKGEPLATFTIASCP